MIRGVPYDAEVEYLESTGTQWIDTGVAASTSVRPIEIYFSPTATEQWFFGGGDSSSSGLGFRSRSFDSSEISIAFGWTKSLNYWGKALLPINVIGIIGANSNFKFNNSSHDTLGFSETYGVNFALFGRNIAGTVTPAKVRIYKAKIGIRDFIPVRVGTTGYLYDRVTRRLFGNRGTGAFVVGLDVATPVMGLHLYASQPPSARDYVRDGLVAMWDGIENAGWGMHNPNATVWKDLVGNCDVLLSNATYISIADDAITATGVSQSFSIDSLLPINAPCTMELWVKFDSATRDEYRPSFGISGRTSVTYDYVNGILALTSENSNYYPVSGTPLSKCFSFGYLGNAAPSLYINGQKAAIHKVWSGTRQPTNNVIISFGSYRRTTIKYLRLYSRALTAAEIAHNYEIDRRRFNLPTGGAA